MKISVLMDSSFFRIFISFFQISIFSNFKFNRPVFGKLGTNLFDFCENQTVFERFFNPCLTHAILVAWVTRRWQQRLMA
jgi:hypothetical protein